MNSGSRSTDTGDVTLIMFNAEMEKKNQTSCWKGTEKTLNETQTNKF